MCCEELFDGQLWLKRNIGMTTELIGQIFDEGQSSIDFTEGWKKLSFKSKTTEIIKTPIICIIFYQKKSFMYNQKANFELVSTFPPKKLKFSKISQESLRRNKKCWHQNRKINSLALGVHDGDELGDGWWSFGGWVTESCVVSFVECVVVDTVDDFVAAAQLNESLDAGPFIFQSGIFKLSHLFSQQSINGLISTSKCNTNKIN